MLVLRTSNFQGATLIRPIVLRHKHSIVYIYSPLNFLPRASSTWKDQLNYFQLFVMKAKCKI